MNINYPQTKRARHTQNVSCYQQFYLYNGIISKTGMLEDKRRKQRSKISSLNLNYRAERKNADSVYLTWFYNGKMESIVSAGKNKQNTKSEVLAIIYCNEDT